MNQTISKLVQAVAPPAIWNAYLRLRGRGSVYPWREFGNVMTRANAKPLLEGRYAELYEKYYRLDPFLPIEITRYRNYNYCYFASLCRDVPGDFLCAGVSWGISPRIVFDFVEFPSLGKTLHLVDPFEGIVANNSDRVSERYNRDPDYVLQQYPVGAPVRIHRERVPYRVPGRFAFIFSDTGNAAADAETVPIYYESLSPGGIFITNSYANDIGYYEPVFARLGITPLWLPSGQGVVFKR